MGLYSKYLLPRIVDFVCSAKQAMRQREKIVPLASGRVLEIGIGSGLNLPYYDTKQVQQVVGLDPSAEMWRLSREHDRDLGFDVEFVQGSATEIPLDASSIDSVLVTYSLCTIPDVSRALEEVRRVLRPNATLLFCEHGAAPDRGVRKWQDRVNPVWKRLSGGCNLNRPIRQLLERSGFAIRHCETIYLPGWRPASFNYVGTASASPAPVVLRRPAEGLAR